ncbi:MAG: gas vesicle protein GvpO [Dehalococcoidia bacterium]|nr:gas vesicle protein GvpO [Dehalococcoidia bacterium]
MMTFTQLADKARDQLTLATGLKTVLISASFKDEQGWHVLMDMLEMKRIPDSTDVLGFFEVLLDDDGNMLKFHRKKTHLRADIIEDEEGDYGN